MLVSEITWETDGIEVDDLPDAVLVAKSEMVDEHNVADFLSSKYGWLISSYVIENENMHIFGNGVNLCDSCKQSYPGCDAHADDMCFGDGKGDDNICACAKYKPLQKRMEDDERRISVCPFCGGVVTVAEMSDGEPDGYMWLYITRGKVRKTSCTCRVFMESEKFKVDDPPEVKKKARHDLIAKWNRRVAC